MNDPRLDPQEQAVAQAALQAGYVSPAQVEQAIAARDAQRQGGQPATLLPYLAAGLAPPQLSHLRSVYERSTGRYRPVDLAQTTPADPPGPGGRRIGRYTVIRELGAGGMGAVHLAQDPELDRQVALKVVLPDADAETLLRMQREAQAAARLDHPGIVRLHTVERDDRGRLVIALEVLEGGSLHERLKREGPLPVREAAALTAKIARAVQFAHDRGILHRDLKPANILLDEAGEPKVTDFGLAKHQDDDQGLTKTGVIMGSPGYMAPEQAASERDRIDQRADVYGLGATLFALLTGEAPFKGGLVEILSSLLTKDPPSPRALRPEVDTDLAEICLTALAREPEDRTPSAGDLARELEDYLGGGAGAPRRRWDLVLIAFALLGTVVALLAYRALPPAPEPEVTAETPPSPDPAPTAAPAETATASPTASPSTPGPELEGWTPAFVLDAAAVRDADRLPGLEAWGTRLIGATDAGIELRANAQTTTELLVPVDYRGGPFRLEVTGRLRLLELNNRLSLTVHPWPERGGPVWPPLAVAIHGAHRRPASKVLHDVAWKPGIYQAGRLRDAATVRRTPDAPFKMVIEYRPTPEPTFSASTWIGGKQIDALTNAPARHPFARGPLRFRLGVNLRPRYRPRKSDTCGYTEGLRGRPSLIRQPPNSMARVRELRLRAWTQRAGTFGLGAPSDRDSVAYLGRLGRQVVGRLALGKTAERLNAFGNGAGPTGPLTDLGLTGASRFALAHVHELRGEIDAAKDLYIGLHKMMLAQEDHAKRPDPPLAVWFHANWSREVFVAEQATLEALARAHPAWQFAKQPPLERAKALLIRPGQPGSISREDLFLSGAPKRTRELNQGKELRPYSAYLMRWRHAESLILRAGQGQPPEPNTWYSLGALERGGRDLRSYVPQCPPGRLRDSVRHMLALIAFRLARWQEAVDWWERSRPQDRLPQARQLFPVAKANAR